MLKGEVKAKNYSFANALPWILIIAGAVGIVCSMFLIYDQIKIWENPGYTPFCSLNPIVSCGTVINSKQGDILRIPGPIWGLIAFPVLLTIGVAIKAGAKFKRWFWQGLQLGATLGVAFAFWLFNLSLYKVHALCPFCLTVDVVVYVSFWYITLYNLQAGNIRLGKSLNKIRLFMVKHHLDILIFWFLILLAWILHHFWYYYGQHFF